MYHGDLCHNQRLWGLVVLVGGLEHQQMPAAGSALRVSSWQTSWSHGAEKVQLDVANVSWSVWIMEDMME
jgi:hypothetical protein